MHGSYETSQLALEANILAAHPHSFRRLNFCFSCDVIQSYFHGKRTDTHLSKFMVYLAKLSRHYVPCAFSHSLQICFLKQQFPAAIKSVARTSIDVFSIERESGLDPYN